MTMDAQTGTTAAAVVTAILGGIYGFIQQQKAKGATDAEERAKKAVSSSRDAASDSVAALAESHRVNAVEWKERWEQEHNEGIANRKIWHDQRNEFQNIVLRMTEENAKLAAKTDITPLVEHMQRQNETNVEVAKALTKLTEANMEVSKALSQLTQMLHEYGPAIAKEKRAELRGD